MFFFSALSINFPNLYFEEHLQEHCPNPCFPLKMSMRTYSMARILGLTATEHASKSNFPDLLFLDSGTSGYEINCFQELYPGCWLYRAYQTFTENKLIHENECFP